MSKEHSLIQRLTKKISIAVSCLVGLIIITLLLAVCFGAKKIYDQQVQSWLNSTPESLLPSLMTSDYFSIRSQIKFLKSSNIFKSFTVTDNKKNVIASINQINDKHYIPIKDGAGVLWGYYSYSKNFYTFFMPFLLIGFFYACLIIVLYLFIRYILNKNLKNEFRQFNIFIKRLSDLSDNIRNQKEINQFYLEPNGSDEQKKINKTVQNLMNEIRNSHQRIENIIKEKERHKSQAALAKIASQVAHDIRSPLAALNAIVAMTSQLPESQRIMIRNATQQINDIANNLLSHYQTNKKTISENSPRHLAELRAELISTLLDAIASEKRIQYAKSPSSILLNLANDTHGYFANIVDYDFRRVISNLVNNAMESIAKAGHITISLHKSGNNLIISIADNGIGMSAEDIKRFTKNQLKSRKRKGHGIGLLSSKEKIESWGGKLILKSTPGEGTTASITLPICQPACWFKADINLIEDTVVVILDDDQSVHDVWRSRFEHEKILSRINLIHFYQPDLILNYDFSIHERLYFLCDYELIGSDLSGLDVIEKLNLNTKSTLVTSRYADLKIRQRCQKMSVRMLPKSYAPYIPITVTSKQMETASNHTDAILIDDNKSLTDVWDLSAQQNNKNIIIFNSIALTNKHIWSYKKSTNVYIDSDLGNDEKGEDYAKVLFEAGFSNIYLITGYDPSDFPEMPWIKKILEKTPPWL